MDEKMQKNLNLTQNSLLAKCRVSVKSYSPKGNFTRKWRVKRHFFPGLIRNVITIKK